MRTVRNSLHNYSNPEEFNQALDFVLSEMAKEVHTMKLDHVEEGINPLSKSVIFLSLEKDEKGEVQVRWTGMTASDLNGPLAAALSNMFTRVYEELSDKTKLILFDKLMGRKR